MHTARCDNTSWQKWHAKEAKKKLKYTMLRVETQRMWHMKRMIIPVITGTTRMVTKGLKKHLEATPVRHFVDLLQKTAILDISHIISKVLRSETGSPSSGDGRWFKRNAREKRLATWHIIIIIIIIIIINIQNTNVWQQRKPMIVLHNCSSSV